MPTHQSFCSWQDKCLSPTHSSLTPKSPRVLSLRSSSANFWLPLSTRERSKQHWWERPQRPSLATGHKAAASVLGVWRDAFSGSKGPGGHILTGVTTPVLPGWDPVPGSLSHSLPEHSIHTAHQSLRMPQPGCWSASHSTLIPGSPRLLSLRSSSTRLGLEPRTEKRLRQRPDVGQQLTDLGNRSGRGKSGHMENWPGGLGGSWGEGRGHTPGA